MKDWVIDRIRKVEDTLLLLPQELTAIKDGQTEIVEHLEIINGTFGELDDRVHKVETKWDYQEKREDEKVTGVTRFLIFAGFVVTVFVALQGAIVVFV